MYNVTLRYVCATIVAVVKQYILHTLRMFVASGIQHAMRVRHSHLWPAWLYSIFSYLVNCMIFEKKVVEHKLCVLIFSTTFV